MAGQEQLHWTDKLQSFDRRWIFLVMAIALVVPFFFPLNLPYKATPRTKAAYYTVEALEKDDVVFMSLDFDPASTPELMPYLEAVLVQLKRKNVKIVFATTWYAAPPLIERILKEKVEKQIYQESDPNYSDKTKDRAYVKDVDYAWLGFREGKEAIISRFGADLHGAFDGRTNDGKSIDQIPWLKDRKQLKDFDLLILVSAGFPGIKEYVQQVQNRYDLKMVGATTAVSITDLTPYYQAGQLLGLSGGMVGAAEYELLIGRKARAAEGSDVLNVGHIVVILAIMFGNFIFFAGRSYNRKKKRGGA